MTGEGPGGVPGELDAIFSRHGAGRGGLVAILQDIQDQLGYLPRPALSATAAFLRVPEKTVFGVATFYAAFSLKPRGKFRISVCLGTACHVRGGSELLNRLERELKIRVGETTPDRMFSIEAVRCLGCCGLAPVFMVNDDVYGKADQMLIRRTIERYRAEPGRR